MVIIRTYLQKFGDLRSLEIIRELDLVGGPLRGKRYYKTNAND